jgi:hypothetical protein
MLGIKPHPRFEREGCMYKHTSVIYNSIASSYIDSKYITVDRCQSPYATEDYLGKMNHQVYDIPKGNRFKNFEEFKNKVIDSGYKLV